jgi:asparagine synthase (glutamine-hydrolysing)
MCGLVGFFGGQLSANDAHKHLTAMTDAIANRGPDSQGNWLDSDAGIFLGHRRLSILDLSDAGKQPMSSGCGRFVLAFNGEIYNHSDLRKELTDICIRTPLAMMAEGHNLLQSSPTNIWRGHSDTETLLAGFEAWGIEATIKKCIGMFAFAVWDRMLQVLTLGRDRIGEKPLYYGWQGQGERAVFLFGSDLKALKAHSYFNASVDRNALSLLMSYGYIPAPYSIYQGISKLQPGSLFTLAKADRAEKVIRYWSGKSAVEQGLAKPFTGTPNQAVDALESLLKDAVRRQMIADVPLGAFLSGGVDSSTVVALMQETANEQGGSPIKTFTIGFNEEDYNEALHAKEVARHLGTDHTELYVSPRQVLDVIPKLPDMYSEPFADSSQIPTFLLSQIAREQVKVSLSGDAGDELFGGYNRYLLGKQLWSKLQFVPVGVRRVTGRALTSLSPTAWNHMLGKYQNLLPISMTMSNIGDKLHKGADVMSAANSRELYRLLVSQWPDTAEIVIGGFEVQTVHTDLSQQPTTDNFVHEMMALDLLSYLPDDILCKVDRAAMEVSLETRVPLLDHRVVEFAWSLPLNYKFRNGIGKWPLRELLYRKVPRELIERPKMGFGMPLSDWLRGPLRPWAEELLDKKRLKREGYFHPEPIWEKWLEHLSEQRNWAHRLWPVLMFQAWLGEQ